MHLLFSAKATVTATLVLGSLALALALLTARHALAFTAVAF
jgi:hypothetical protein